MYRRNDGGRLVVAMIGIIVFFSVISAMVGYHVGQQAQTPSIEYVSDPYPVEIRVPEIELVRVEVPVVVEHCTRKHPRMHRRPAPDSIADALNEQERIELTGGFNGHAPTGEAGKAGMDAVFPVSDRGTGR